MISSRCGLKRGSSPDPAPARKLAPSSGSRQRRVALLACGWCAACTAIWGQGARGDDALERFEFVEIRMGIPVNLVLYASSAQQAAQASRAAYQRIRDIDRLMSDYDTDSELFQLCATYRPGEPVPLSEELFLILKEARHYSLFSDGAFDVSVGPLVKVWRSARRQKQLPSAETIAAARQAVGFQYFELDDVQRSIVLKQPGMKLDLGAIAKGYAADQALKVLAEHGIRRALVEAGGDIAAGDPPPDRDHWRIEVEKVRGDAGQPLILAIRNRGVATSGDAYQFVEINGVRYSHLVDPATGLGLTQPGSVTVVAPSCLEADGMATAVIVAGPERGLQLIAKSSSCEALLVLVKHSADGAPQLERFTSPGFNTYLK